MAKAYIQEAKAVNKPMKPATVSSLSRLFKLPINENQNVTCIDWTCTQNDFVEAVLPRNRRHTYRATDNRAYYRAFKDNDSSIEKIYHASYAAESRVSQNAFSMVIASPVITGTLYDKIQNVVSNQAMPNFKADIEGLIRKEESKIQNIQSAMSDMIDFNNLEATLPQNNQLETPQEMYKKIKQRKREWRDHHQQIASNIRIFRNDIAMLERTINALKPGGIMVYITLKQLIDTDTSYKLGANFDNLRFYRSIELEEQDRIIVIGIKRKKKQKVSDELREVIEEARFIRYDDWKNTKPHGLDNTALKQLEAENPYEHSEKIKDNMRYAMYHYLPLGAEARSLEAIYPIPVGSPDDIAQFRVGPVTNEELREAIRKSKLNAKVFTAIAERNQAEHYVTPTPLHEGHTVMLLTSGGLNGYIGTGVNQHLVKGSSRKEVQTMIDTDDDGNIVQVEREYYNITVRTLDANGEFKEIL